MMKKLFFLIVLLSFEQTNLVHAAVSPAQMNQFAQMEFIKFKFNNYNKINFLAFKHGLTGYINIKESGKSNSNIFTICDFTLSSTAKRMWILDMKNHKVLLQTWVAHGQGSGEEYATSFSNVNNSHQSSIGFYITGSTYLGSNGLSLKLYGIDGAFNNNVYTRDIVIHGADYVSQQFIQANRKLGRSHGCPAVDRRVSGYVVNTLKNGTTLFIYSTSQNYLKKSKWLTDQITSIKLSFLDEIKEKQARENDTKAPFIPKTLEDSIILGLIKPDPNKKLSDGTYLESVERMTKEEYTAKYKNKVLPTPVKKVISSIPKSEEISTINKAKQLISSSSNDAIEKGVTTQKFPVPDQLQGKKVLDFQVFAFP